MELNKALEILGEYKIINIKKGDKMEVTTKITQMLKVGQKKDGTPYKPLPDGSDRFHYKILGGDGDWYSTWNGGTVYGHNEGDSVIIQYKTGEYGNEIISLVKTDDVDINTDMQEELLQEGVPMEQLKPNVQPEPPVSPKTPVSKDRLIVRQVAWKVTVEAIKTMQLNKPEDIVAFAHTIEEDIMR